MDGAVSQYDIRYESAALMEYLLKQGSQDTFYVMTEESNRLCWNVW